MRYTIILLTAVLMIIGCAAKQSAKKELETLKNANPVEENGLLLRAKFIPPSDDGDIFGVDLSAAGLSAVMVSIEYSGSGEVRVGKDSFTLTSENSRKYKPVSYAILKDTLADKMRTSAGVGIQVGLITLNTSFGLNESPEEAAGKLKELELADYTYRSGDTQKGVLYFKKSESVCEGCFLELRTGGRSIEYGF